MKKVISELHKREFHSNPEVVVSTPGVICLLGEILDCNDGYVLQAAIDRRVFVSISKRTDNVLNVYSENLKEKRKTGLSTIRFKADDKWLNYVKGVMSEFSLLGLEAEGVNIAIAGDIPMDLSLGSSSALCVAIGVGLRKLFSYDLSDIQLIQSCYLAEARFMGIQSSISDCYTAFYAEENKLLYFDLRTVEHKNLDFQMSDDLGFYITDSNLPLIYPEEEYEQDSLCTESLDYLKEHKSASSLRDFTDNEIKALIGDMPESLRRVSLHVVQENQRVLDAVKMIKDNKIEVFGKILNVSHKSLRDNFEISCPEVDWLVKRSYEIDGVLGSRLISKKNGGCICSLINSNSLDLYKEKLIDYESIFGFKAKVFQIKMMGGVEIIL